MEGVAKWRPVALQAALGQAQSDVQGHCQVATATSFSSKVEDIYEELTSVCSKRSLMALIYSHSLCD
jgi:hypothetical protein